MKRFSEILVFIDNEDEENLTNNFMIKKAVRIARLSHAKITVIGVIKEILKSIDLSMETRININIQNILLQKKKKFLEEIVGPFKKKKDVAIDTKVLAGVSFLALIRNVLKVEQPLLMVAGNPVSTLRDRIFGTTILHLLRKCPCPVWVFKPSKRTKINRMLVTVDTNTEFDSERQLNQKLMAFATSLSELEGASLHVLHCWELMGESYLRGPVSGLSEEIVDDYLIDAKHESHVNFNNFLLPFQTKLNVKNIHCQKGDPGQVVPVFVKNNKIDLIIMGTVARTGIQGFLIGNTAESILEKVNCSVMAVKPDKFISPVITD